MSEIERRLLELGTRVERMAVEPDAVTAPWTVRLTRPFYRLLGWQPALSVQCMSELLTELQRVRQGELSECRDELDRALDELETNVLLAERACVVNGRVPVAQTAWLSRMTRVLGQAAHALEDPAGPALASIASSFDPVLVAPPLAVSRTAEGSDDELRVDAARARLVELELAAVDHIIEAARAEQGVLARRRSLLEAARRLLLDADAALELDGEGVALRKQYLARQIVVADRLQACGLAPGVSLLHQARGAVARGQRDRLYAALVAMEGFASAAGDLRSASLAQQALDALGAENAIDPHESLAKSVEQVMGNDVVEQVHAAYARAREELDGGDEPAPAEEAFFELAMDYLTPGAENATLSALLSVDGCFDVGAPLAPVRIQDERIVARIVEHPTQELMLTRARGPEDVPASVLTDPRAVIMDLAAGRLLARKFVRYEQQRTERIEMMGEVRVYLLDGSTSMMEDPARARMRDAILSAELATLMRRFQRPDRYTRVLMFYRYFTKRIWPLHRIASATEALAAIGDVLGKQWEGGTDIERALITCFDMIRDARAEDHELARGQIVLITDGEATVSERVVREARERIGEIPIAVSVIALGEENAALRRLVARQRARGERAFYHYIDDGTLAGFAEGTIGERALHLPDDDEAPASREELEALVGAALEEAAELERSRHRVLASPPTDIASALAELGLPPSMMTEGQRAAHEAAERDRRALENRYRRWFPPAAPTESEEIVAIDREDAMVLVLATVAEVVSELHGDELTRKADAIDVLERLLPDAKLSPAQYDALASHPTERVQEALEAVHRAVHPEGVR